MHHAVSTSYRDVISEFSKVGGNAVNKQRCRARNKHQATRPLLERWVRLARRDGGAKDILAACRALDHRLPLLPLVLPEPPSTLKKVLDDTLSQRNLAS